MKRIIGLLAFLAFAVPAQAADNVAVTAGSGKTMACLEISSVCYSKLIVYDTTGAAYFTSGNPGFVSVTNTNANGQAIAANSSPVVLPAAQVTVDPCSLGAKTNLPISFQTTTLTQIIAASGSTKIYICSLSLIASGATVFSLSGGTGSNCASNQLGILGVAGTATHGLSLAANGGLTLGNGSGTVAVTAASSEICIVQSGAGDISGNLTYVQQ